MRILVLSFFLLIIISCNQGKGKAPDSQTVKRPDSSRIVTDASVNPFAQVDVSPMDMAYFPTDYPKLKMAKALNSSPFARIIYSRPHLQGRHIFHEVLKYGEPWRLGANESTELDLYHDASIGGKKIKSGRYVIYCIPWPEKWVIVLNSNLDSWGLQPDSTKDIEKFTIPVSKTSISLEYFTMVFEKINGGADLLMAWDNVEARLPIKFE